MYLHHKQAQISEKLLPPGCRAIVAAFTGKEELQSYFDGKPTGQQLCMKVSLEIMYSKSIISKCDTVVLF